VKGTTADAEYYDVIPSPTDEEIYIEMLQEFFEDSLSCKHHCLLMTLVCVRLK